MIKNKHSLNVFLILILASSISFAHAEGHESGGGGGVIIGVNKAPQLVDFLNLKVSRQDIEEILTDIEPLKREESEAFNHAQMMEQNDPAYVVATQLLGTWIDGFYKKMSISPSRLIFNSMTWSFAKSMQYTENHYRPSNLNADKNIYTGAYFYKLKPQHKVIISVNTWNQMHSIDQIGLLIHEMLRNYQLGFGQNINDEVLQKATAMMVYCKPETKNTAYLLRLITIDAKSRAETLAQYDSVVAKCR
jgi:hypothetical protein